MKEQLKRYKEIVRLESKFSAEKENLKKIMIRELKKKKLFRERVRFHCGKNIKSGYIVGFYPAGQSIFIDTPEEGGYVVFYEELIF